MWNGGAIHNRLVISKHEGRLANWNTKISKSSAILNRAFDTRAGRNKFGALRHSLDGSLFLAVPIHRGSVEQVKDTSDGLPSHIMVIEIGVDIVHDADIVTKRFGSIVWDELLYIAIDRLRPVEVVLGNA